MNIDTSETETEVLRKRNTHNVVIEPINWTQVQLIDKRERLIDTSEIIDQNKNVEVFIEWLTNQTLEEFVETLEELYLFLLDSELEELARNKLLETEVEAFSNLPETNQNPDYRQLASLSVQELKSEIGKLSHVDWERLYSYEVRNKNRKTVKQWIDKNRTSNRKIRYDSIKFCELVEKQVYPDEMSYVRFGSPGLPTASFYRDDLFLLEDFVSNKDSYNKVQCSLYLNVASEHSDKKRQYNFNDLKGIEEFQFLIDNTLAEYATDKFTTDNVSTEIIDIMRDEINPIISDFLAK